jgi:hypothetical protein
MEGARSAMKMNLKGFEVWTGHLIRNMFTQVN